MRHVFYIIGIIFALLITVGVSHTWADTWLYGSFQNWEVKDNDYKFSYDGGGVGTYYLELDAATEYEFKIIDGDNYYSMNNANFTTTTTDYLIYTGNGNCKITTGEAGVYVFKTWWDGNNRRLSIYFPQARLKKQTYIYFDARRETNWQENNPDIRYWYKYYDSGDDVGSVDCNKSNALENWVYYALVPNNDYVGRIQLNRLNPSNHNDIWCFSDVTWAKDRTSSAQNCLKEESGKENYCNSWTPQWTTYCPPMSSVTMADNGTTNWGGDGSSATPYLVPTGGDIKVHVTASASALDDANMTPYFLFKKEGSAVGSGAASTEKTITASSITGTKEAVIVEAYNYYNATEGTHLPSAAIYYEARTPYTISYNKGTPAASISGSRESEIKLKDVTFTLPGAVFTRTGYTQTGWATSDGGAKAYELSASYTDNAALALYPVWTPKSYTVTLEGMEPTTAGQGSVSVTFDASDNMTSAVTQPTKTHYDFGGYWTEANGSGHQLINATGAWIASVDGYTDSDKNWLYAGNLTLYAKWTEHEYTISIKVDGLGATEPVSQIYAKYVTASDEITATASTGYSFREWDFSKTGEDNDVYSAEGYTSLSNPICINARHDGTLTAKFTANNYNVNLENLDADEKGTENVSVTYNSSVNLTENITIPQKAHYDFGGYWTEANGNGHQLINATGAWIASVEGYTDSDKNWLYTDNLILYAKWTERPYTIALVVSPEGAGTIKIGEDVVESVNAFISTQTDLITATPANPAWKFKEWKYSENVGPANDTGKDNTVQITAAQNGTLEAVFEPRFCLVGSIWDDSDNGGMPGWHDYDHTADFNINSYTDLSTMNLTCVRSLKPNTTYKFEVHDKVNGKNLGYATLSTYIGDQSLLFNTQNNDVFLRVNGHGECTFTISALSSGDLYPTVSVAIPASHQLKLEWADVDIDNNWNKTSRGTGGSVSAQTTESGRHFDIQNDEYVAHGGAITYTATPATGYTFEGWYNNDYNTRFSTTNPYTSPNIQTTENVEAKFVEKATAVTLSNDGHGHVEINDETVSNTTVGITTHRELTAVPDEGYKFSYWTLPDNADFEIIEGDVDNPTITLRGKGAGTAGEIIANFTECWVLSAESEGWGSAEFTIANIEVEDGKAIGYADIALPANTDLQFKVVDKSTSSAYKYGVDQVYYMTYGNSQDWNFGTDKTYNCGITTAGRGSYRFNWNFTDKTMTVVYPESYQVNYGAAVGGSVTSVLDDNGKGIPNGGYVRKGGSVTYEATASDGYTFTGWCPNDSYGDIFTDHNPWENSNVTATSNAYAKFHSTNFVIYRKDDKSSDPRDVWDDVESYDGGTISEIIEFRMKVNELDYWYTLCLPFEVNAVQVWDEVDGAYYDIVPYYRTGGKFYTGHYVIRTPVSTTDFAIENFDSRERWTDPSSPYRYLPSKNTPYIIQWHDEYFQGKYISFFGDAGQTIPTAMDKGSYASSDETVNIYGNNSMTTGTVCDAYLLDPYYGSDGAWMREELGTDRSILPFECFILANERTTAKYRVLRRDMADDTPTGLDTLSMTEDSVSKVMINNRIYIIRGGKIYTIQGTFVKEVE